MRHLAKLVSASLYDLNPKSGSFSDSKRSLVAEDNALIDAAILFLDISEIVGSPAFLASDSSSSGSGS